VTDTEHFARIDPAFRRDRIKRQAMALRIDGGTYVAIAFFTATSAALGTDEAAKYISAALLFWLRVFSFVMGQSILAFKTFRSTSFAAHMNRQAADDATDEGTGTGTRITTQITQPAPVVTSQVSPPEVKP